IRDPLVTGVQTCALPISRIFLDLPTLIGGACKPQMIAGDTNELLKYYRGFGFRDVGIAHELEYTPAGREVAVIFHIQEGVRYRRSEERRVGKEGRSGW